MRIAKTPTALNTGLGVAAIVLWSATIALGRSLSEQLGAYTAGAMVFGLAGTLGLFRQVATGQLRGTLKVLSPTFVLRCGALFALYQLCLYLALGLSANRSQVLEVALVHYLWPMLTLFFAVFVLRVRAKPPFWFGGILGMLGVGLAMTQGQAMAWGSFRENLAQNGAPYLIAVVAAVSWALYSVSSRQWSGEAYNGAVVLWMLLAGALLATVRLFYRETTQLSGRAALELAFLAISANLAYGFWDRAMRKGDVILVASFSYFTPLLSTLVSSLYLGVVVGVRLWIGCALVILGAVTCNAMIGTQKDRLE